MKKISIWNSIRFAWPLYVALTLFILAAVGGQIFDLSEEVSISVFGMFSFNVDVEKQHLQFVCGFVGVLFLASLPFRDYSKHFPTQLNVTMSFDNAGINDRINRFPSALRDKYKVDDEASIRKKRFFEDMDNIIAESKTHLDQIDTPALFFDTETDSMFGAGHTSFIVTKRGIGQSYRIEEANGDVKLSTDQKPGNILHTRFTLSSDKNSAGFCVSIKQMLFDWVIYIEPVFSQVFLPHPTLDPIVFKNLIVITPIRFFPYIGIGDSVYIYKDGSKYTPIGYCVYSEL